MFTLCDNCRNHYDDESQSPICQGIGVAETSYSEGWASSHRRTRQTSAIGDHVANTRATRSSATARAASRPGALRSVPEDVR